MPWTTMTLASWLALMLLRWLGARLAAVLWAYAAAGLGRIRTKRPGSTAIGEGKVGAAHGDLGLDGEGCVSVDDTGGEVGEADYGPDLLQLQLFPDGDGVFTRATRTTVKQLEDRL